MRSSKSILAGLAAGALVAGVVPFAIVATATSANAADITGTVGPVRAGTVGTIPAGVLSFAKTQTKPTTVSLVTAPSATARVTFSPLSADDTAQPSATDDSVVLGTADSSLASTLFDATTGDDSVVGISASEAGTYTVRFGASGNFITASFTTAGAPASVTLTPATQSILVGTEAPDRKSVV